MKYSMKNKFSYELTRDIEQLSVEEVSRKIRNMSFNCWYSVDHYMLDETDAADHQDWRVFDGVQREIENDQQKHKTSNLHTK